MAREKGQDARGEETVGERKLIAEMRFYYETLEDSQHSLETEEDADFITSEKREGEFILKRTMKN